MMKKGGGNLVAVGDSNISRINTHSAAKAQVNRVIHNNPNRNDLPGGVMDCWINGMEDRCVEKNKVTVQAVIL
jgi:hypothetical protein